MICCKEAALQSQKGAAAAAEQHRIVCRKAEELQKRQLECSSERLLQKGRAEGGVWQG